MMVDARKILKNHQGKQNSYNCEFLHRKPELLLYEKAKASEVNQNSMQNFSTFNDLPALVQTTGPDS